MQLGRQVRGCSPSSPAQWLGQHVLKCYMIFIHAAHMSKDMRSGLLAFCACVARRQAHAGPEQDFMAG